MSNELSSAALPLEHPQARDRDSWPENESFASNSGDAERIRGGMLGSSELDDQRFVFVFGFSMTSRILFAFPFNILLL